MPGRSEWGEAIQAEEIARRKRRWRVEITEHDRMLVVMKLERLTPGERSPAEKALLEFFDSLPRMLSNNGNDPKKIYKKPPRKGRKLANRPKSATRTAYLAAKEMDAYNRRVAAAERKQARMERKSKAEKKPVKKTTAAKKAAPVKKTVASKKGVKKK